MESCLADGDRPGHERALAGAFMFLQAVAVAPVVRNAPTVVEHRHCERVRCRIESHLDGAGMRVASDVGQWFTERRHQLTGDGKWYARFSSVDYQFGSEPQMVVFLFDGPSENTLDLGDVNRLRAGVAEIYL